jgi:eukaryotic-like serine/threonine-protein kinase
MDHLAEQSVIDLAAGVLVAAETAAVHAHLDRCAECRAVVAHVVHGYGAAAPATGGAPPTRRDAGLGLGSPDPEGLTMVNAASPPAWPLLDPRREVAGSEDADGVVGVPLEIDEYRLLGVLGSGGMGTVYRAHDTLLEREVAIKLITRAGSESARQRFLLEARAVARIRHPNVVVVHRVGFAAEQPYIVYDLVRGRTFRELRSPMPWPKVLELAAGAVRGLTAAHACNVLHRDIKPANLMIDEVGDVVLVDFGLAKLDGDGGPAGGTAAPVDPRMTVTGATLGTPRYMAPEAWRGAPATPQTDLYSLGVVLYELLAGRLPFDHASADDLRRQVCGDDPPPVGELAPWVPPRFGAIIDRCVARDPAQRPAAAAALGEQLEALQRGRALDGFERDRVRSAPLGNPYPGARPFGFEHQGVFFGRHDELRALVDQLRARPFVVVTGDAGAGKSSLCMAGLLPIVMRGALGGARKWVPVAMTPGPRPLATLAGVLADHVELPRDEILQRLIDDPEPVIAQFRAGHRGGCTAHVLFIDQLEELLTVADRGEARQFAAVLGKLAEPAPALRVLATLRTQDMMAVAQLPGLATAIGPALYLLLEPRDEAALREIVVEPARLKGGDVEAPVASSLVAAALAGELRLGELEARLASLWDARG